MAKRGSGEDRLRRAIAKRQQQVLADLRALLDRFPCPTCGGRRKADAWLRVPEHRDALGQRCAGSLLVIGWFVDGVAAIPQPRRDEPECKEARARLVRTMAPALPVDAVRQSTSVIGRTPTRGGPDVSGGLPGSSRRH